MHCDGCRYASIAMRIASASPVGADAEPFGVHHASSPDGNIWEDSMVPSKECLRHTELCKCMAKISGDRKSEAQWRGMAERWARRALSNVEGPLGLRLRAISELRPETSGRKLRKLMPVPEMAGAEDCGRCQ
jgi:hypothetical protein